MQTSNQKSTWNSLFQAKCTSSEAASIMGCSVKTATKNLAHQQKKAERNEQNELIGKLWGQQTLQISDRRRPSYDYEEIANVLNLSVEEIHTRLLDISQYLYSKKPKKTGSRDLATLRHFENKMIAKACGVSLGREKTVSIEYAALFPDASGAKQPQDQDVYQIMTSCLRYMAESGTNELKRKEIERVSSS